MGIERILAQTTAGPLLGGLSWRPPSGGRHTMRKLFEARNLATDATHYVLLSSERTAVYGLFQPRASEESLRIPKGTLSAAHCFATQVGGVAPNAALILRVRAGVDRKDEKVYVVVLEDGVPVIDSLTNEMEARNALGSDERRIWSDDPLSYPNAEAIDLQRLGEFATKTARVAAIPLNPWPLAAVAAATCIGLVAWMSLQHHRRAEEAAAAERLRAESDPAPRYLTALARQSRSMASRRGDMIATAERLFSQPVQVPGWRMKWVECSVHSQQCATTWLRQGGTYAELKQHLPDSSVVMLTGEGSAVPLFDLAKSLVASPVQRVGLPGGTASLAPLSRALERSGDQFQVWKTADLAVEVRPPALWPKADGVPPSFEHPAALVSGTVTVSDVPGPFVAEVLADAPEWISWDTVRADIGDGEPASRLKFKITGNYYASLR